MNAKVLIILPSGSKVYVKPSDSLENAMFNINVLKDAIARANFKVVRVIGGWVTE